MWGCCGRVFWAGGLRVLVPREQASDICVGAPQIPLFLLGIERPSRLRRQKDRATLRLHDWGAKDDSSITGRTAGVPGLFLYGAGRRGRLSLCLYPRHPARRISADPRQRSGRRDRARLEPARLRAAGGQRHRAFRQCLGLPDLERDRAGGADRSLFHGQDTHPEPVGADRGRRTRRRDLARAGIIGDRRAQRRLDDLLTVPDKPTREFGMRRPVAIPAAGPVKRSGHVALLLMGTFAVGGGAYALMPRECTPAPPGVSTPGECPPRGSSSGSGSGGGSSRYDYYSGGSSGSTPAATDAGSGGVKRGGFGAFAQSFSSHFS